MSYNELRDVASTTHHPTYSPAFLTVHILTLLPAPTAPPPAPRAHPHPGTPTLLRRATPPLTTPTHPPIRLALHYLGNTLDHRYTSAHLSEHRRRKHIISSPQSPHITQTPALSSRSPHSTPNRRARRARIHHPHTQRNTLTSHNPLRITPDCRTSFNLGDQLSAIVGLWVSDT